MKRTWSVVLYYKNGTDDCVENISLKLATKIASSHGRYNSRSIQYEYGVGKRTRKVLSEATYYLYSDDFATRTTTAIITLDTMKKKQLPLSRLWELNIRPYKSN